jgi:hypothetical protein
MESLSCGYINGNYPNTDPAYEGGAVDPTYEFYPTNGAMPQVMQFMIKSSGPNSYAHTFLLLSGNMFVRANISTSSFILPSLSSYLFIMDSDLGLQQ